MSTPATVAPAVRAAFTQFIDYAGLFPPAKLDMAPALAEFAAAKDGGFAWMLGRFIVPASRIGELLEAAGTDRPVALSVIVDAGTEPRTWLSRVQELLKHLRILDSSERAIRIEALEVALPPLQTQRETYDAAIGQFAAAVKQAQFETLPAFVELPRDARRRDEVDGALFALARHRLRAKLRCGGVVAEAFPDTQEVAAFIHAANEEGVPMKATAGLHHPIRHRDAEIGVMMHGFVNLLAAAVFARLGMDRPALEEIVACEDAGRFGFDDDGLSWNGRGASVEDLRATRGSNCISYGSCSFVEPVTDLQTLGLL